MSLSVPIAPNTEFFRSFVERVRATVAPEHTRTADAAPAAVEAGEKKPAFEPEKIRRVTVETAALTPGSAVLYKQYGDLLRVAYDPAEQLLPAVAVMVGQQLGSHVERLLLQSATEVARQWTITTENGVVVRGYQPPWAEGTPSGQNVRPDMLHVVLEDITHTRRYEGAQLGVHFYSQDAARCGIEGVLIPRMTVEPHAENPANRVPTVSVEILAGLSDAIEDLDPDGVCALADKLRAHADYLDDIAADLQDARDDWAKHGGAK
jgi:hypothetical protein